jgi:uncharacterized protein
MIFASVISPAFPQAAAPSNPSAQAARILRDLSAGNFSAVESRFDTQMAKDLPEKDLADSWKTFATNVGAFQKVVTAKVTPQAGGYQYVAMSCAFERNKQADALVVFNKSGSIAGLYFGPQPTENPAQWTPPDYAHSDRFHEIPLTVTDGPWHLPATLTLPNGAGPFPAVILVPGSPPLDQDATVGPNKIFKDIAWGLASRGIAVLRYTKRTHQFGAGLGGGQISSFSLNEELLDDARAAIALLSRRSEVDHRHTFLLGHSMGGEVAPQIAADDPTIAGIVIMGASPGNLLTVLIERVEDSAGQGAQSGQQASSMIAALKKLRDGGFPSGQIVTLFGQRTLSSYWEPLRKYEPGIATANLKIPALIVVGGHDAEGPPDDFERWKRALAANENDTVKFYPALFHLFMPSSATQKGQDSQDDWSRPAHVPAGVITEISSWLLSHSAK